MTISLGLIIVTVIVVLIFFGAAQSILDRMHLTDTQALILLGIIFLGAFLPEIPLGRSVSVDIGGAIVPLGIAVYLLATAGTAKERTRGVLAALVTAAVIFTLEQVLPTDPGVLPIDIDPIWLPAIVAGIVGYAAGRSRRAAFIAGSTGLVLVDLFGALTNAIRGVPGAFIGIGSAGIFDGVIIGGVLAVVLAEIFGESREFLQGGPGEHPQELEEALTRPEKHDMSGSGVRNDDSKKPNTGAGSGVSTMSTLLVIFLSFGLIAGSAIYGPRIGGLGDELIDGSYFSMFDQQGNLITESSRRMFVDDEYIDGDNRWYQVVEVDGNKAIAKFLGLLDFADLGDSPVVDWLAMDDTVQEAFFGLFTQDQGKIAIYHTHNAESYVLDEGTESVNGRGGIHDVGRAFSEALEKEGFEAIYSDNMHLPHDRGAYRRSRRTALNLAKDQPEIIFDVHRDAVPPEVYSTEVDGEEMVGIKLVVGRQNPNRSANLQFAKELKAIADKEAPGLIKGIFFGKGNYNQDIGPKVLLLEVGAHSNAKASAEKAVAEFAKIVARYNEIHGNKD